MPVIDDNSLLSKYIRAIENPDSLGFRDGRWYRSPYDANARGFGIDVVKNKAAAKAAKDREGKWLTVNEERDLRNGYIGDLQDVIDRRHYPFLRKDGITDLKRTMATGLLYRGDGINQSQNLSEAYYNGTDSDFQEAVRQYYIEKGLPERARLHNEFIDSQASSRSDKEDPAIHFDWKSEEFKPVMFKDGGSLDFIKPETAWDSLSLPAKAEMMRVAVANGIFNLNDIKKRYNEFAEGGPKRDYNTWKKLIHDYKGIDVDNDNTYDYPSYYNNYTDEAWGILNDDPDAHFRDAYKTAYHPTFSNESIYSGIYDKQHNPRGIVGGRWLESPDRFIPSPSKRDVNSIRETANYVSVAEPNSLQIRDEYGRWPVIDGTVFGGVLPQVSVSPSVYSNGGPLVQLANRYDGYTQPTQQMYVAKPDALYVKTSDIIEPVYPDMSESGALKRANHVYSNYDKAKDNPIIGFNLWQRNARRYLKDNVWDRIPAGISNCTLTATQWVDPTNFVKSAASIISGPEEHGYTQISENDAVPGNLIIAKVPGKESYHTMMIEGFTDKEGSYEYNGKPYSYRKGEPLVRYSRGGHDDSFLRTGIPLSVYTANSDGHVENYFYRYNYPNSIFLDEITVTPDK